MASQAPLQGPVASLAHPPLPAVQAGGVGEEVLVGDAGGDPVLVCSVCPSMLLASKGVGSRFRRWLKSSRRSDRFMVSDWVRNESPVDSNQQRSLWSEEVRISQETDSEITGEETVIAGLLLYPFPKEETQLLLTAFPLIVLFTLFFFFVVPPPSFPVNDFSFSTWN